MGLVESVELAVNAYAGFNEVSYDLVEGSGVFLFKRKVQTELLKLGMKKEDIGCFLTSVYIEMPSDVFQKVPSELMDQLVVEYANATYTVWKITATQFDTYTLDELAHVMEMIITDTE